MSNHTKNCPPNLPYGNRVSIFQQFEAIVMIFFDLAEQHTLDFLVRFLSFFDSNHKSLCAAKNYRLVVFFEI